MDIMDDLNFNIYAFVKPTTPEEYVALLNEALSELDSLSKHIDDVTNSLNEK